jgi:hypothetical protein
MDLFDGVSLSKMQWGDGEEAQRIIAVNVR